MTKQRRWFDNHPQSIEKFKNTIKNYKSDEEFQIEVDDFNLEIGGQKLLLRLLDEGAIYWIENLNSKPLLKTSFVALLYSQKPELAQLIAKRIYLNDPDEFGHDLPASHPVYLIFNYRNLAPETIERYGRWLLSCKDTLPPVIIMNYVAIWHFIYENSWVAKRILQYYINSDTKTAYQLQAAKFWKLVFNNENQYRKYLDKIRDNLASPIDHLDFSTFIINEEKDLETAEKHFRIFQNFDKTIIHWPLFAGHVKNVFHDNDLAAVYLNKISTSNTNVSNLIFLAQSWLSIAENPVKAQEFVDKALFEATAPEDFLVCAHALAKSFKQPDKAQNCLDRLEFEELDPYYQLRYIVVDQLLNGDIALKKHPPQKSYRQLKEMLLPSPDSTDDFMTHVANEFLEILNFPFDVQNTPGPDNSKDNQDEPAPK